MSTLTEEERGFAEGDLGAFTPARWRELAERVKVDRELKVRIAIHRRKYLRSAGLPLVDEHSADLLAQSLRLPSNSADLGDSDRLVDCILKELTIPERQDAMRGAIGTPCSTLPYDADTWYDTSQALV